MQCGALDWVGGQKEDVSGKGGQIHMEPGLQLTVTCPGQPLSSDRWTAGGRRSRRRGVHGTSVLSLLLFLNFRLLKAESSLNTVAQAGTKCGVLLLWGHSSGFCGNVANRATAGAERG